MNFGQAVVSALTKYVNGNGRASRSEYWWFILFNLLVGIVADLVDFYVLGTAECAADDISCQMSGGVVGAITGLLLLLPNIALGVRRLHDVNRSGWWLITIIPPFIWSFMRGTTGPNDFGADPLAEIETRKKQEVL